jgi:hypothetical protein
MHAERTCSPSSRAKEKILSVFEEKELANSQPRNKRQDAYHSESAIPVPEDAHWLHEEVRGSRTREDILLPFETCTLLHHTK